MQRRSLVAIVFLPIACTPASQVTEPRPSAPAPVPPLATAPASPSATAVAASAVDASAPPADTVPEPVADTTPKTIALKGAPLITIRQLGAALIEVTLAAPSADNAAWDKIEIERKSVSRETHAEVSEHDAFTNEKPSGKRPPRRRAVHTARPGTTYTYRARTSGDWSEPVKLYVAAPSAPPPAPSALTARAETPFAVRLGWKGDVRDTSGFEVEVNVGEGFVRAGLVNPTAHEFVQHMRLPGQQLDYRVRAFNSRGASAPTAVVSLTLPERVRGHGIKTLAAGPCVHPTQQPAPSDGCNPETEEIDTGNGGVLYNAPGHDVSCRRHLMGDYKGCRREFGVFELQADVTPVPNTSNEGWPLLHAIAGAGEYVGASILTLQFSKGRYYLVDQASFCGERWPDANDLTDGISDDDLTKCFPPFDECQTQ